MGQLLIPVVEGAHLGDDFVRRVIGVVAAAVVEEVDEVSGCGWNGSEVCGRGGDPRVTLVDGLGTERRGNGGNGNGERARARTKEIDIQNNPRIKINNMTLRIK